MILLKKYQTKRKFGTTPEPKGVIDISKIKGKPLRFVVQKHQASRLHYDFRLEVDGVLKSWAIPKGPSLNPTDKRLAIMVEDHPFDYKDFEGIIPEGNYGAGEVIIWDEGIYQPVGEFASRDTHSSFQSGLKKGHLVFILSGHKLKGEFALIKLNRGSKDEWLLVKARDKYASKEDVLSHDKSVRPSQTDAGLELSAPKKRMPKNIKPMMAILVDKSFNNKDWIFEIKWDGYRALTEIQKGKVHVYSRNNKSFDQEFAGIYNSFIGFKKDAIFDGEIVVVDSSGRSDFQLLQKYRLSGEGNLVYYVFDLLYYDGHDLTQLPLTKRREALKKILPKAANIKFSEDIKEFGKEFFEIAKKQNLEGVMAKLASSKYQTNKRSRDWLKIKNHLQQEVVICGFTSPMGKRIGFGSLILGVYDGDKLIYIGNVGTGFDDKLIEELIKKLKPLIVKKPTFPNIKIKNSNITWVRPRLVCEIRFQELTSDGHMRQPVFLGLREDKFAKDARRETADTNYEPTNIINNASFVNSNKVFWPKSGLTKGDVLNYYQKISKYILPHLENRPESLSRFPNGIDGESFYQKNVEDPPKWAKIFKVKSGNDHHLINYLICNNIKTLTYMINLGCIDLNVWSSRYKKPNKPDFLVFDLDPDKNTDFKDVLKTALVIKGMLDSINIKSYPKTSGKYGMHIYVPLRAKYTFNQTRNFAYLLCLKVNQQIPEITSLERLPKNRKGKVYLDYLQNHEGATMAAPYTVRPVEFAGVSTPLLWQEVENGFKIDDFTIYNIPDRLEKFGDIFAGVLGKGINIKKALKKLELQNK